MDGELPPESEGPLRAHVETCVDCRTAADELASLDKALRSLVPDPAATTRIADHALKPISTAQGLPPAPPVNNRRSAVLAALAAAGALAAAILVLVWPSDGKRTLPLAPNQIEITLATGNISVLPPETDEWQPLSLPSSARQLVGFQLQTQAASLCEFRCPSGSVVRVDEQTELHVTSPTEIGLARGRIWCATPGAAPLTVVPSGDHQLPSIAMTCQPAAEMQTTIEPTEPVRVVAARGPVQVADATHSHSLKSGTLVRYAPGGWSEPANVNSFEATEWMLPLLALRGGNDREFSSLVTSLLSRLGTSKLDYVHEERLISLGSPASIPLIAYLRETPTSPDVSRRRRAARIIAQTAADESIPDLIELLSDPLSDVRVHAAEALKRLTGLDQGLTAADWKEDGDRQKAAILRWRDWLKGRASRTLQRAKIVSAAINATIPAIPSSRHHNGLLDHAEVDRVRYSPHKGQRTASS